MTATTSRFHLRFLLLVFLLTTFAVNGQKPFVRLDKADAETVNVWVDDRLFTSYRFGSAQEKPVLFPVIAAGQITVTRGYPIQPRPGERIDHPHHTGVWFNYGDVNGVDYWNNSFAIPDSVKSNYGSVKHRRIVEMVSGSGSGKMRVESEWVNASGKAVLAESTEFRFFAEGNVRGIDRVTTLRAVSGPVVFRDNKEGLFAIRVAREFEEPVTEPEVFVDASGRPSPVAVLDNTGVNGLYRNSEGDEGASAWGRRARWVALTAVKDNQRISIALVDHPSNPGYPAHWHARTYGLFSVNNFGSRVFVPGDPFQVITLPDKGELSLRHRLLVGPSDDLHSAVLDRYAESFR